MKNGGRMVSRCHLRNKGVNVMTENEVIELKKSFEQNELFQKSISPYKDFQLEQFCMNGEVLTGVFSKVDKIDDVDCLVIFNFDDDGLIHSNDDNSPAIEYLIIMNFGTMAILQKLYSLMVNALNTGKMVFP